MKRISKNLLFWVVALLMVFTTSEVMAQAYQSCTFAGSSYTIKIKEPFPLAVTAQTDPGYNTYPCTDRTTGQPCQLPYFVYVYEVTPNGQGINALTQLFPVCQNNPFNILAAVPAINHINLPGTPENYTAKVSWPLNIWDSYSVTWNGAANTTYIITSGSGVSVNSMALKSGSNVYYCNGGILGPGCECGIVPASMLPGTVYEEVRYGAVCAKIERDIVTWCAKKVTDCITGQEILPANDLPVANELLVQCGDPRGNQRCMECVIFTEGSPACTWYIVNGQWRNLGCK